jgi:hypothetical protein
LTRVDGDGSLVYLKHDSGGVGPDKGGARRGKQWQSQG